MLTIWGRRDSSNVQAVMWCVGELGLPHRRHDWPAIRAAVAAYARVLDVAEARLDGRAHLAGDDFTLADVQFGHVLHRYHALEIDRPSHPAVRRYYDRLTERPAYREHVMVSYEALRAAD